jgi:predicted aspartyl protease
LEIRPTAAGNPHNFIRVASRHHLLPLCTLLLSQGGAMRVLLVAGMLLAGAFSVPHAAAPDRSSVTTFEGGQQSVIVLPVMLNGRGPFRFLLDTGSTHTAVSARTAAEIGAQVVARAAIGSAAGTRDTLVVRVGSLEVGPIEAADLLASIVNLDGTGIAGIDGVLGHDALASICYTIDFRQRRVVWWPDDSLLARGSSFALEPSHGRFLVTLPQRQSRLRLVPDTGADTLLLFDPDRTLPVTALPALATLTTMSGVTEVRLARIRELHVGTLTLRDVLAVVAERDSSEPAEVDGLLPLHLFDRVTVDGPRQRMIVEKTRANGGLMFF